MPLTALVDFTGDPADTRLTAELAEGDARPTALVGMAVPFGTTSRPDSLTRRRYRFSGPPANAEDLVDVVEGHDEGAVIGRLAEPWSSAEAGLSARARMFKTSRAADVLELASEGVLAGFSVQALITEYAEATDDQGPYVDVSTWEARHLGVVRNPAFTEARGLTLAASALEKNGSHTMPETAQLAAEGRRVEERPTDLPTVAELAAQVAQVLDEGRRADRHPLDRFASREAYLAAFQEATHAGNVDEVAKLTAEFVAAEQIITDNPGLTPPTWRTEVKANLDRRRPAITQTGGPISLPASGMDSSWPYFAGDLDAMVTEQAAEFAELNSVKVSILKGTAAIKTAGVYSDLSYQLLMRSTPSYLAQYLAINEAAWARFTEAVFEAEALAKSTKLEALAAAGAVTADEFRGQLFGMSQAVEDATGAPASIVLASSDVFRELGGLSGLHTPDYGTQNTAGTSSARTLKINVNGLEVTRAPFLDAGNVVATNELAVRFAESGAMTATEEDVARLGRNVATWGMYVPAEAYFPAGIVRLDRLP